MICGHMLLQVLSCWTGDFIMALAKVEKRSTPALERRQIIHLTNRDRDLFLAALEKAARPNRVLRKAAERFKRCSQ